MLDVPAGSDDVTISNSAAGIGARWLNFAEHGKPIGLALLPTEASEIGEEFSVDIRGREARARIVPTPFYKRAK